MVSKAVLAKLLALPHYNGPGSVGLNAVLAIVAPAPVSLPKNLRGGIKVTPPSRPSNSTIIREAKAFFATHSLEPGQGFTSLRISQEDWDEQKKRGIANADIRPARKTA